MNADVESSVHKGSRPRNPLCTDVQVSVFRRDPSLCHWCGRPVMFPPALLDEQAAVVNHRQPRSQDADDDPDNLVTAYNRSYMKLTLGTLSSFLT